MTKQLTYLASPYSHPEAHVREWRFQKVCAAAAALMRDGELVFSPIAQSHPIALYGALPLGFDFWERYDRAVLACCRRVLVYKLPGWDASKGVAAEIAIAIELDIPVDHLPYVGERGPLL